MLKFVLFTDVNTAQRNAGQPDVAMISITLRGPAMVQDGWFDVLRLEFQDTDDSSELFAFDPLHARRIDDFVANAAELGAAGILVHCHAGISRSAAVAKWIALQYKLPFDNRYDQHN